MFSFPTGWGQWLTALVALFLVPAAGSAFWDFIAKPLLIGTADRVRNATMKLVTLGSRRAQTRFFEAVARRSYLHPAVAFWCAAYFAACGQIGLILAELYGSDRTAAGISTSHWVPRTVVSIAGYFVILALYRFTRTSLLISYIRRFDHLLEMVAPLLSEQERLVARSKFAMIENAADYKKLIDLLRDTAVKHQNASADERAAENASAPTEVLRS
ncbi:hypothetical protein FVF58_00975 [Paraburkholderia panacisoli]|uniref:Uncharacterized protein n=1 Tax=Paraburkholderia panacisoli TaxID=2603818 RepID=A0A5B0HL27_9BURK|nr:hypothetical protein [Paraburkholderia panacisoli]KAA1015958.1 hypothetical protein FVF58_00975 [Paraburkholderia panacisoli]